MNQLQAALLLALLAISINTSIDAAEEALLEFSINTGIDTEAYPYTSNYTSPPPYKYESAPPPLYKYESPPPRPYQYESPPYTYKLPPSPYVSTPPPSPSFTFTAVVTGEVYCDICKNGKDTKPLEGVTVGVICWNGKSEDSFYGTTNDKGAFKIELNGFDYTFWGAKACAAKLISASYNATPSCTQPTNLHDGQKGARLHVKAQSEDGVTLNAGPFAYTPIVKYPECSPCPPYPPAPPPPCPPPARPATCPRPPPPPPCPRPPPPPPHCPRPPPPPQCPPSPCRPPPPPPPCPPPPPVQSPLPSPY